MTLYALSPLDGRYANQVSPLRDFCSEFAFHRSRVKVEIEFLASLSKTGIFSAETLSGYTSALQNFTEEDARKIQKYDETMRHDVKAIEYFLREKLPAEFHPYIHFGLTSEDVNNIAQALLLRDSREEVLLPALDELTNALRDFAKAYRALPLLARTHGQPAVPTTLGKEIAVYLARLLQCRAEIADHTFEAKLTGAVGNFNSWQAAAPEIDWISFNKEFLLSLQLQPNLLTTQILPYDNWIRYFDSLKLTNSILIDYAQDIWRYISDGTLKQKTVDHEVGSSTMPQKVNPIDFENAEGNLGVANALLTHYGQKLPISRLQRDLSDSTVRRTFGVALGHTLLAWNNVTRGMSRIEANEEQIKQELNEHWEVISEAAQTILRAAGQSNAYESLKAQTHGRVLSEASYRHWVESLDIDQETRTRLANLSPESYIGLAVELVDEATRS
ncbi:MAG TPA: adenylosuccinate lyase [Anaerolineales bacterium]|jgi:adenylosuccinate lyase|nr:adenylosuccinate lyase [Anaerolineales bacterium]